MDGQNSELVKQQVQAELANAYAQEFFTVRMPDLVLDLFPTLPLVPSPRTREDRQQCTPQRKRA